MANFYSKTTTKGIYYGGSIGKFDEIPTTSAGAGSSIVDIQESKETYYPEKVYEDTASAPNTQKVDTASASNTQKVEKDTKTKTSKNNNIIVIALAVLTVAFVLFYPNN